MSGVDVLLDVDGVINAVRYGRPPSDGWDRHETYKHIFGRWLGAPYTGESAFTIRYSPDLVEGLNGLAEVARFHWLTTWLDEAAFGLSKRVGLAEGHEWPVLGKPEYEDRKSSESPNDREWWKLVAARRHAAANPDRRIVWIDDDLIDTRAREWVAGTDEQVVAVCPESQHGITREMFDHIADWIAHVNTSEDAPHEGLTDAAETATWRGRSA